MTPDEVWWWERISMILPDDCEVWAGHRQNSPNCLECPGVYETFEFGDIRIELPNRCVVIEIEKEIGGGASLSNLLKFWPWLEGKTDRKPERPFTLLHIWGTSYPTLKVLWRLLKKELLENREFLVKTEFLAFENGRGDEAEVLRSICRYIEASSI